MVGFLLSLHVLLAILLIIVILMQQTRGGGLSSIFGGSSQFFGGRGAEPFFLKITSIIGGLFMLTSILLAFIIPHTTPSLEELEKETPAQLPPGVGE